MKKTALILILILSVGIAACGKKQQSLQETEEPISMEALSRLTLESQTPPAAEDVNPPALSPVPAELETLPPPGSYKPTKQEIQTALKNAGFYSGAIDGKIGPLSKKAIEEFQKANSLKVDGKVGPTTWEALSKYLNPQPAEPIVIPVKKKR